MSVSVRSVAYINPFDVYNKDSKTLSERIKEVSKIGLCCLKQAGRVWIAGSFTALTAAVPLAAAKVVFIALGMVVSPAAMAICVQVACGVNIVAAFYAVVAFEMHLESKAVIVGVVSGVFALLAITEMSFLLIAAAGIGLVVSVTTIVNSREYVRSLSEKIEFVAQMEIMVGLCVPAAVALLSLGASHQAYPILLAGQDLLNIKDWVCRKVFSIPLRKLIQPMRAESELLEPKDIHKEFFKTVLRNYLNSIPQNRLQETCENFQVLMFTENSLMLFSRLVLKELLLSEYPLTQGNTPLIFWDHLPRLNELRNVVQGLLPVQRIVMARWVDDHDVQSQDPIIDQLLRDIRSLTWGVLYPPNDRNHQVTQLTQFFVELMEEHFFDPYLDPQRQIVY